MEKLDRGDVGGGELWELMQEHAPAVHHGISCSAGRHHDHRESHRHITMSKPFRHQAEAFPFEPKHDLFMTPVHIGPVSTLGPRAEHPVAYGFSTRMFYHDVFHIWCHFPHRTFDEIGRSFAARYT